MTIEEPSEPGAGETGGETLGAGIVTAIFAGAFILCNACHPNQPAGASKSVASAEPKMSVEDLGQKDGIASTRRRQRLSVSNTPDFSARYVASQSTVSSTFRRKSFQTPGQSLAGGFPRIDHLSPRQL